MIFATAGTNEAPFDRLLEALDALPRTEPLVVQHGASAVRPRDAHCVDFLAFEELVEHVRAARVVVTHAGVGSVTVALANGKRPLVVPRLRRFGEAVDDHQVVFARRFADAGLVTLVEDPCDLEQAVANGAGDGAGSVAAGGPLVEELAAYVEARASRRAPRVRP